MGRSILAMNQDKERFGDDNASHDKKLIRIDKK